MARRCLAGCGQLIPTGSYCTHCRPRNGSTTQWRKTRERILERDNYTCRYCGCPAAHVDHVLPVHAGGTDNDDNLAAACATCNLRKGTRWSGPKGTRWSGKPQNR